MASHRFKVSGVSYLPKLWTTLLLFIACMMWPNERALRMLCLGVTHYYGMVWPGVTSYVTVPVWHDALLMWRLVVLHVVWPGGGAARDCSSDRLGWRWGGGMPASSHRSHQAQHTTSSSSDMINTEHCYYYFVAEEFRNYASLPPADETIDNNYQNHLNTKYLVRKPEKWPDSQS